MVREQRAQHAVLLGEALTAVPSVDDDRRRVRLLRRHVTPAERDPATPTRPLQRLVAANVLRGPLPAGGGRRSRSPRPSLFAGLLVCSRPIAPVRPLRKGRSQARRRSAFEDDVDVALCLLPSADATTAPELHGRLSRAASGGRGRSVACRLLELLHHHCFTPSSAQARARARTRCRSIPWGPGGGQGSQGKKAPAFFFLNRPHAWRACYIVHSVVPLFLRKTGLPTEGLPTSL